MQFTRHEVPEWMRSSTGEPPPVGSDAELAQQILAGFRHTQQQPPPDDPPPDSTPDDD